MPKLDLIVFGATGFTGKYTVEEIVKLNKTKQFAWGVAGRNKAKLEKLLNDVGQKYETDLGKIPVVIADVDDVDSLEEMATKTRVVVNCCGPYIKYGEPVIKACIAKKTHHVDVSGEPRFIESMQLKYNAAAKENGVYVISACGFDSIPADLGVVFFSREFSGEVNSIETYLESWRTDNGIGAGLHYGTWESAVYGIGNEAELKSIRKQLYSEKLPELTPKLKRRFPIHKNELVKKWCLPFIGSDRSIIQRSQRHFFDKEKQRPIQVNTYVAFPNLLATLIVTFIGVVFFGLSKFSFGRKLLLSYPRVFSLGMASHEGPSEEDQANTCFSITFFGEGWSEKLSEATDKHTTTPDKKMVTRVSGRNPGYGATCVMLIMSALTILKENSKMPDKGGVFPPGAAFAKTSLVDEVMALGVKFEVVSREDWNIS